MKYLIFFLFLIFGGCATYPAVDTLNKQLAVFEIAYQETLKSAILLHSQGRLSEEFENTIDTTVRSIEAARIAVYTAIAGGDPLEAKSNLLIAQKALSSLSLLLRSIEGNQDAKCDNCDRASFYLAKYGGTGAATT